MLKKYVFHLEKWIFETIAVTASFVNGFAETVFRTKVQYAFVLFLQIKCFLLSHFCIFFMSELTQILFYVSLLRFNFVSALQCLGCYCNEQLVKQTASLYLKLPLKPAFLECFCYSWKDKSLFILNLFISKYIDQSLPSKEIISCT